MNFFVKFGVIVFTLICANAINVYVDPSKRIDCDPEPGSNQQSCESRGCVWDTNFDSVNFFVLKLGRFSYQTAFVLDFLQIT